MPNPYVTRVIAGQLSRFTRYYDAVVQFAPLPNDDGLLLRHVACDSKSTIKGRDDLQVADARSDQRVAVLLHGNLNHDLDIEGTLASLRLRLNRLSRLVVVLYNPYFRGVFWLATRLGLRTGPLGLHRRRDRTPRPAPAPATPPSRSRRAVSRRP